MARVAIDVKGILVACLVAWAACDTTGAADQAYPPCTQDGCHVSLAEATAVCAPTYAEATTSCPGVTARFGPCDATFNRVRLDLQPAAHDCYYAQTTGQLVGAVLRSDAGFTRVAGNVPETVCAEPTSLCDSEAIDTTKACPRIAHQFEPDPPPAAVACSSLGSPTDNTTCPQAGLSCWNLGLNCVCHVCQYGSELYLNRWTCSNLR